MGSNVVLSVSASRSGRPTIKAVSRKFGSKAIVLLQHSGKRNSVGNGLKCGAFVSCRTSRIGEDLDLPRYSSRIRPHPNDHSFVLAGAVARNGKGERKKTLVVVDIESMQTHLSTCNFFIRHPIPSSLNATLLLPLVSSSLTRIHSHF